MCILRKNKDYPDAESLNSAIDLLSEEDKQAAFDKMKEPILPIYDVNLSIGSVMPICRLSEHSLVILSPDRNQYET